MISSIINKETRDEIKLLINGILFPIKLYCIVFLLLMLIMVFQNYLILTNLKQLNI